MAAYAKFKFDKGFLLDDVKLTKIHSILAGRTDGA